MTRYMLHGTQVVPVPHARFGRVLAKARRHLFGVLTWDEDTGTHTLHGVGATPEEAIDAARQIGDLSARDEIRPFSRLADDREPELALVSYRTRAHMLREGGMPLRVPLRDVGMRRPRTGRTTYRLYDLDVMRKAARHHRLRRLTTRARTAPPPR